MARVTVEDCIDKVENRFDLVLLASHRARMISSGSQITIERDNDKNPVVALREIADTTLNIPHPYPVGAATAWIESHPPAWAAGTNATFAIVETKTGKLVGAISLMIKREHRRAELGYWIARGLWNNGYATESSQRLLDFGFEFLGLHRIEARHFVRNPASGQVMRKLGMQQEGVERDWAIKWDRYETLVVYSILEPEWRARR